MVKRIAGIGTILLWCWLLALVPLCAVESGLAADMVTPKAEPATLASPPPKDDLSGCAFITNDCEVCTLDASGKASCSSQGIACVPTKRRCLIEGQQLPADSP